MGTKVKPIRLDRLLSNLGYGSRKGMTIAIKQGSFSMDGEIIKDPAFKIDASRHDCYFEGERLEPLPPLTLAMNKPPGIVCDNTPDHPNIFETLPSRWRNRTPGFSCAGRLDKDSRGLVILSEDGDLVHRLISPKTHIPKTYRVRLSAMPDQGDLERFQKGGMILKGEKKPLKPVDITILEDTTLELVLHEGRHRQIRRMVDQCGVEVLDLMRAGVGALMLDSLDLEEDEFRIIREDHIL